jgi:uncharacterized membrane protein YeaQ/YmgE (transglycosylase-associated protein family)
MNPEIINWLIYLGVGGVSGWLESILIKGAGLGVIGNILLGTVGSCVSGYFFGDALGSSLLGHAIMAALGATVILIALGFLKKLV